VAGNRISNPTLDTITTLFQSVFGNDFPAPAAAMARIAASAGGRLLVGFQEASIINAAKRAASLKELASTQHLRATTFAGPSMRVDATK
jgi:hypothetical protein